MKPGIHPDYHEITVEMTNGKTFKTRSTYGKEGDVLKLDVDPHTHNAWTGGSVKLNEKAGRVAEFNKRFGGLNFSGKKEAQPEAKSGNDENKEG